MEEVDLTLVTTQKDAVMAMVEAEGFDHAEFEWRQAIHDERDGGYAVTFRNTISVLVHKETEYFFRFEKYRSKYSPAHQLRTKIKSWDRLIDRDDHMREWLFNLRTEVESLNRGDIRTDDSLEMSAGSSATVQAEVIAAPQPILAPESNNPRAFVSHSSQDHEFVEKFSAELRQHGVDAWYAGWEIKPGDSIRAKIDEGLEGCEFFIIVLSKNSINRPWVQKELDAATMRNISGRVQKIIPIKIENCGNLPPTLGSLCWEDFSIKPYELAIERILHSILGIDGMPPLGSQPTASTSRFQRSQMSGLIADLPQTSKPMSQEVDAELWSSITVHNIGEFADVLRNEGFAAKGSMFIGQCGLDVGPKGLDPNRMPKPGSDGKTISALFFPLWELNHRPNRRLVNARKFHDIEESRPPDWLFNRPYHEIILVGSERLKQRAAYNGFILSVSYNGRVFAQEVRDPLRPELFSTADIYPTIESARIGAIRATQHMGTADGRETTHGDVDWVDVVE